MKRKRTRVWATLVAVGMLGAAPARAVDVWDASTDDDNDCLGADNALTHGDEQVHDLDAEEGVPDQDWYTIVVEVRSSYEARLANSTGDLNLTSTDFARYVNCGVRQVSENIGGARSLRWQSTVNGPQTSRLRVGRGAGGVGCGAACTSTDQYRIRFYDTTYTVPWFDNSGERQTVLNVANRSNYSCNAEFYFYNSDGAHIRTVEHAYSFRHELFVLDTRALPLLFSTGSIKISHTCGYDGLAGNAVEIDPTTGSSITPLVPLLH